MPALLIAFLVFSLIGLAGLIMGVFFKGRRRLGWAMCVVGLLGAFTSAIVFGVQADQEAKAAGFLSYGDRALASKKGVTDPIQWGRVRDTFAVAEVSERATVSEPGPDDDAAPACEKDLSCWGEKAGVVAAVKCPVLVEKEARYSARWTTGFLEPKFSYFRWADEAQGWVTVIGDRVVFQNAFGAEQRMTYECDVDPRTKTILEVRVAPGAL